MEELLQLPRGLDGQVWTYLWLGRLHPMHHHAELEANLVVEGTATYIMGERRYKLGPGSMVWLFPQQDHLLVGQTPDFRMRIAVFAPHLIARLCLHDETRPLRQANPTGHFCRRIDAARAARLGALWSELEEARQDAAQFNAGLAYLLLSAWSAYRQADDTGIGHDIHPAVERAARLIAEIAEPLSLADLAHRTGLSPSHLSRIFREQMGLSLGAFRHRQCCDRFLRLYGQGRRRSMMEAALEAGFGSYAQFYRVFTHLMGCTPAAYRRLRRGSNDFTTDMVRPEWPHHIRVEGEQEAG